MLAGRGNIALLQAAFLLCNQSGADFDGCAVAIRNWLRDVVANVAKGADAGAAAALQMGAVMR